MHRIIDVCRRRVNPLFKSLGTPSLSPMFLWSPRLTCTRRLPDRYAERGGPQASRAAGLGGDHEAGGAQGAAGLPQAACQARPPVTVVRRRSLYHTFAMHISRHRAALHVLQIASRGRELWSPRADSACALMSRSLLQPFSRLHRTPTSVSHEDQAGLLLLIHFLGAAQPLFEAQGGLGAWTSLHSWARHYRTHKDIVLYDSRTLCRLH